VGDLLDFARIKSGDREFVPVARLVQQALERYQVPLSVEVAFDLPADLPNVFADPRQIIQVLGNLTMNAYQAMSNGGKLSISARHVVPLLNQDLEKKMIEIYIKDTGTGISPENLGKIFDPLFTTKVHGVGLGLVVCQKLAEANAGWIDAKSEPGKGSTFTLVLPACEDEWTN
jgi:signal transduction histidine kinase